MAPNVALIRSRKHGVSPITSLKRAFLRSGNNTAIMQAHGAIEKWSRAVQLTIGALPFQRLTLVVRGIASKQRGLQG